MVLFRKTLLVYVQAVFSKSSAEKTTYLHTSGFRKQCSYLNKQFWTCENACAPYMSKHCCLKFAVLWFFQYCHPDLVSACLGHLLQEPKVKGLLKNRLFRYEQCFRTENWSWVLILKLRLIEHTFDSYVGFKVMYGSIVGIGHFIWIGMEQCEYTIMRCIHCPKPIPRHKMACTGLSGGVPTA